MLSNKFNTFKKREKRHLCLKDHYVCIESVVPIQMILHPFLHPQFPEDLKATQSVFLM